MATTIDSITHKRRRRRRATTCNSGTARSIGISLLLLLHTYQISAFNTAVHQNSITRMFATQRIVSRTLSQRIPQQYTSFTNRISPSRLYGLRDLVTTAQDTSAIAAESSVELQYSEFKHPSNKSDDDTSSSHPPVIFLHGLLGNKRNFASLASSLSTQLQNPRSIYTLDLRNHGENTHDWRSSMSYSQMARDVLSFMDKVSNIEGEQAVLVGHSMGGKVAQSLALMFPDRVAGLVVLDIAPVRYYSDVARDDSGGSAWKAVEDIVKSCATIDLSNGEYTTKRDVDAVLRNGMLEDPALRAFVLTNLEQLRDGDVSLRWKINWDGIVNELDSIASFDVHDQDTTTEEDNDDEVKSENNMQYEGDVFYIHGGASRFVRHSYISTIASYFPNHMLTTIRGVGHWVHAEAPDDTIALLKRYLDR